MERPLVVVDEGAWKTSGRKESVEILEFCGYEVKRAYDSTEMDRAFAKYIISSKQPSWRGWKCEMCDITVHHHKRMQQWHRWLEPRMKE